MKLDGVKPPEPGRAIRVTAGDSSIAVFNLDGRLFGLDAKCSHVGGPLDQGTVENFQVTCPWHRSVFDVRTGAVVRGPAVKAVKAYRVTVEGTGLLIEPA